MVFEFDAFNQTLPKIPVQPLTAESTQVRLQYLIDNTTAIIYASDPAGDFKITYVSGNAQHILGYAPEQMVSDTNFWFNHIHPDDIDQMFSSLPLLFTEGQRTYEYRFMNSSGDYVWMHDRLRLIRDEQGNAVEVVGSLTDITQRKTMEEELRRNSQEQQALIEQLQQAQQQLLQSEKMASVGQLAAGIAHEINNPIGFVNSNMNSLNGYVSNLLNAIDQITCLLVPTSLSAENQQQLLAIQNKLDLAYIKEDITDLINESLDGLKRVKDIVQSLKDFSHVDVNEWQQADIHHGLDSTLNIVKNEIKYKATVEKNYGTLPLVVCILSQLNQVFMNLFINAAHAISDTGTITISTGTELRQDEDWIWITISDTGSGIPPAIVNRIFEPFFTTKPIGSGTGLGLSLAYGIINNHGGSISVTSELNHGTCFRITLPVNPKTPTISQLPSP